MKTQLKIYGKTYEEEVKAKLAENLENEKLTFIDDVCAFFKNYNFNDDVSLWLACLAALESDFGRSRLARENYNLVSMKVPFVRISNCVNYASSDTYAKYSFWYASLIDLVLWMTYKKPLRKELDDVTLLPSLFWNYCPERDYITKINNLYQHFKNLKK